VSDESARALASNISLVLGRVNALANVTLITAISATECVPKRRLKVTSLETNRTINE
jgi:hypothetical protein